MRHFVLLAALLATTAALPAGAPDAWMLRESAPELAPLSVTSPARSYLALPEGPTAPGFGAPLEGEWHECGGGVRLRLSLLNTAPAEGAPLRFRLEMIGIDEVLDAEVFGTLVPGYDLRVMVTPPGSPSYNYLPVSLGAVPPNTVVMLSEGERHRRDIELIADPDSVSGALLDFAGNWRVSVAMRCVLRNRPPEIIDLGTFPVTVLPAAGDDAKAKQILAEDPEVYRALIVPAQMTPKQTDLVRRALTEAPNAQVAPRLAGSLAFKLSLDEATVEEALTLYRNITRDYPTHPVTEDCWMALLSNHTSYEREPEATRTFQRIWADPVMSQLLSPDSKLATDRLGVRAQSRISDEQSFE